jgi:hypothetical protein
VKKTITLLTIFFSIHSFAQLSEDLLTHYSFDGNTHDITGQGYDGIPFGVTYVPDQFGNPDAACYFNGLDNYIEFPNIDELKTPLPVSFSFWVKYDNMAYQNQVILNTSFENNRSSGVWFNSTSATNQYAVNFGDGGYNYIPDTRRTFVSNSVIEAGWHHVAVVVHAANDMQIYIDKIETGGYYSGYGGPLQYSLTPGCIGRHDRSMTGPADYFKGTLDEFFYFSRALTQTDVDELYNQLSVPNVSPVKTYVSVHPNPAHTTLNIDTNLEGIKELSLYDSLGQVVLQTSFMSQIDVSSYKPGLYFLKLSGAGITQTKKILIK